MFGARERLIKRIKVLHREFLSQREGCQICISHYGGSLIIDDKNQMFEAGMIGTTKPMPFSALVAAEVVRDNVTISRADLSSEVVGAALGGILLGGAGAIVGGLSASRN